MKTAKYFAMAGTIIMFLTLVYGFVFGDFREEGGILMSMAWGHVSLIEIYIGFAIVGGWVIFRENHFWRSVGWIMGILILGNFLTCFYIWLQLERADGNVKKFWFGNRVVDRF